MPVALAFRGVSFAYERGQPVLEGVDLEIHAGELVAIAGPNGGGKTTLVRLALGLERPASGAVELLGEPAHRSSRRAELAYLAQRAQLSVEAPVTVRELVSAGRVRRTRAWGPLRVTDRERVDEAIERVGLTAVARRPVNRLSGGQQQRAFLAKALAAEPSVLVLDEPTAGVDVAAQEALAELLEGLHRDLDVTVLYVSHEFGSVERFVERLVLVSGGVLFDGVPSDLPGRWHDPSHVHARS